MRSPKEKFLAIRTFQNELKVVPNYTMFGDNNHEQIKTAIEFIKGLITLDDLYGEDEDSNLISFICDIETWMSGNIELVDLLWNEESLVKDMPEPEIKAITVCKKMCNDCPFSNNSLNGFLADYSIDDFITFHNQEISFPCHKATPEDTDSDSVNHEIMAGRTYFCRGYVESVIKSGKLPYKNELLKLAINKVKESGLSDDSMSLIDFINHHKLV